jgi:hypothetical protein
VFSWVDPTMPSFSSGGLQAPGANGSWWCPNQPNFLYSSNVPHIQACGTLDHGGTGVCMNDRWCWETLPFVCKKSILFIHKIELLLFFFF